MYIYICMNTHIYIYIHIHTHEKELLICRASYARESPIFVTNYVKFLGSFAVKSMPTPQTH